MTDRDRREHVRRTVRYPAWIAVRPEQYFNCELSDISEGGAKIKVSADNEIPDRFILAFSLRGKPNRACRVVWRSEQHLGLQFVQATAAAATPASHGQDLFEI